MLFFAHQKQVACKEFSELMSAKMLLLETKMLLQAEGNCRVKALFHGPLFKLDKVICSNVNIKIWIGTDLMMQHLSTTHYFVPNQFGSSLIWPDRTKNYAALC